MHEPVLLRQSGAERKLNLNGSSANRNHLRPDCRHKWLPAKTVAHFLFECFHAFPLHGSLSLLLCEQPNPIHASLTSNVDYVRDVFEINVIVAADERYSFRPQFEDVVQPVL